MRNRAVFWVLAVLALCLGGAIGDWIAGLSGSILGIGCALAPLLIMFSGTEGGRPPRQEHWKPPRC